MSKQTGNFLGLTDAVDLYTADGMRIGLADAGDAVDDANFTSSTADTGLLRLHSLYQWIKDIKASIEKNKTTNEEPNTFADNLMLLMKKMLFRDALRAGFYELVSARDAYVIHCESTSVPLNTKLVNRFIDTIIHLLYPIAPHFCDHIWRKILGNSTFLWQETFPSAELTDEDVKIINESKYLNHIVTKFRSSIDSYCNPKAKKGAKPITKPYPSSAKIQIGTVTPPWQIECSEELKKIAVVDGDSIVFPPQRDLAKELSKNDTIKKNTKKAVPFAMMLVQKVNVDGLKALDIVLNFDEVSFLSEMKTYIQNVLKLKSVELCPCTVLDEKLIPGEPIMNNFE
ncbi:Leucyl-tRNA synthetase [Entamoeba marina]